MLGGFSVSNHIQLHLAASTDTSSSNGSTSIILIYHIKPSLHPLIRGKTNVPHKLFLSSSSTRWDEGTQSMLVLPRLQEYHPSHEVLTFNTRNRTSDHDHPTFTHFTHGTWTWIHAWDMTWIGSFRSFSSVSTNDDTPLFPSSKISSFVVI